MRTQRRWMNSVVKQAAKTKVEMPWARGPRRDAFIAKRTGPVTQRSARA